MGGIYKKVVHIYLQVKGFTTIHIQNACHDHNNNEMIIVINKVQKFLVTLNKFQIEKNKLLH